MAAAQPLPPSPPPSPPPPPPPLQLLPKLRRLGLDEGNSPLHLACYRGSYDRALMLLLAGSDVEARWGRLCVSVT